MRLLLVEDNPDILANLVDYLHGDYVVDCVSNGVAAFNRMQREQYDLIVLDIMLPGLDGLALCQKIRTELHASVPIIMLTARDQVEDRLLGLQTGADDYLIKPFALSELKARIDAVLRRSQGSMHRRLQVADLSYDLDTLEVSRAGKAIKLDPISLKLLAILMQRSPDLVRREALESAVWGEDYPDSDSLRSHIYKMRTAIDKSFKSSLLHTVHGIGYRLVAL